MGSADSKLSTNSNGIAGSPAQHSSQTNEKEHKLYQVLDNKNNLFSLICF